MKLHRTLLKLYLALSGVVFLLVGVFHLLRLISQWPVTVGSFAVPMLLSYTGLPGAIGASVCAAWLLRKMSKERSPAV
jgi:hypothetical protein